MRILVILFIIAFSSVSHADRIRLLADDKEALQARLDLIQQAKFEIVAEYFSVWNDNQSIAGFALLLDAAKRGVRVRIIMDALSNSVPASVFANILQQGKDAQGNQNIEIKLYNPMRFNVFKLTHRDHAKMLIVDGERMITGGRNVGDKYFGLNQKRNFSDMDVILDGNAVRDAREDFLAVWNSKIVKVPNVKRFDPERLTIESCVKSTQKEMDQCEHRRKRLIKMYGEETLRIQTTLEDILRDTPTSVATPNTGKDWLADVADGSDIQFVSHKPESFVSKKTADLSVAIKELAMNAKTDLNIMSPYLIPTKNALAVFEDLIKNKKVKIRIVTNSLHSTDNLFAQAGYLHYKKKLIKMGVELYEFNGPDTSHGKACVVDGNIAFVGTYNLDPRSAFINREIGIFIRSSPGNLVAQNLTAEIELFRQNSLLVGKDGLPQNEDIQKQRMKEISPVKRAELKVIRLLMPFIKSQI